MKVSLLQRLLDAQDDPTNLVVDGTPRRGLYRVLK